MSASGSDLVITVTFRVPMERVREWYADALTPDGGYSDTFNSWVEGYAKGVIDDMKGAEVGAPCESSWQIKDRVAV